MDDDKRRDSSETAPEERESRPQQAGEAGTTRFGMEDGDNTDIPATGGPTSDEDWADESD